MTTEINMNPEVRREKRGSVAQFLRGAGKDVTQCGNDPELIAQKAGLNWKAIEMPMLIQGRTENRPFDGWKALVRSDNGKPLAPVGEDYRTVQPSQIIGQFADFARDNDALEITHAGSLYGGRQVFVVADLDARFDLGNGDVTQLRAIFSTGYGSSKSRMDIMAFRLICQNGLMLLANIAGWSLSHRGRFGDNQQRQIDHLLRQAIAAFGNYEEQARILAQTPVTLERSRELVTRLIQPATPEAVAVDTVDASALVDLDAIVNQTEATQTRKRRSPAIEQILEAMETSPGAETARGSLWGLYNGITYWTDHVRGRSTDAAVASSLYGDSQRLKTHALELILQEARA